MRVEILRRPTERDWQRCKTLALNTVGKVNDEPEVTEAWKRRILRSGHSPVRTLMFTIRMELPYWVSVHFARHKFGVEHYVTSQRNDRQDRYDRNEAPQGQTVTHIMDVNAAELIQMAQMRLCGQAAEETREMMQLVVEAVLLTNPEFEGVLVPKCLIRGGCNEFRPCGTTGVSARGFKSE